MCQKKSVKSYNPLMSFAGSLILTGLGGVYYKFSRDQHFKPLEIAQKATIQDATSIYQRQLVKLATRSAQVSAVIADDLFTGNVFVYPFKGMYELYSNFRDYAASTTALFSLYLVSYAIVTMVYWATITPVYTALFIVLGPFGILIAWIHSILHTNMLTMMFLRVSHLNEGLVKNCVDANGYQSLFRHTPIKYQVSPTTPYFWYFHLAKKLSEYLTGLIILVFLLIISSIPIVGPFTFHFLVSPALSRVYFSKMLRLKGLSNIERYERIYQHPGQYTMFGITAGFLDSFPFLAGISLSTNILGATLLGIDQLTTFR